MLTSCSKKEEIPSDPESSVNSQQEELDRSHIFTSGSPSGEEETKTYTLYIGTYTRAEGHVNGKAKGIHKVILDKESGQLTKAGEFSAGINPSYLIVHPSGKNLYAVNEGGGRENEEFGRITAMAIDESGDLTQINSQSTQGIAPCHLGFDRQFTNVMVANYVTGNITSYALTATGKLGGPQTVIQYQGSGPDSRQEGPHAHYIQALPDGQIITADLGTDSLRMHSFQSGQLQNASQGLTLAKGSGPRHLAIHPNNGNLYTLNELTSTVTVITRDADGNYIVGKNLSILEGRGSGSGGSAAIKISPDGQYLYASNRGNYNDIAIMEIDNSGEISLIGHQSSLGNTPRDFAISPDGRYLVVANQDSDNLVSFRINNLSGLLQKAGALENVNTPVCVQFL